ncbi:uncharacterized protein LOC131254266 [Magnolia sinica]|uniref:uncharacterized protein LOC131254266 n=1 Tax=Magnolia sinica TaxID=86752 RepID=UPI00265805A6|nr:uncharacterized protein LOC131254266 [Magnolia sinica]
MTIANHKVYHILVDTGSSVDVIYSEAFERMKISRSCLRPMKTPLYGFAGERVISEGAISLLVIAGEGQHQVTLMVDFLIVNVPSVHNVILGRPSLNAMRAVVSTYHLMMKFSAKGGIGYLRGDQCEAQRCYAIAVKKGSVKQVLTVNVLDPEGPIEDSSVEDLEKHRDVFAWSHGDMPGISPDVMVHRMNVDPDHKPVKKKRRPFDAELCEAIADEVFVLLSAGFIEEVHYPDWIANVVIVKKANGKWWVCVDYSDPNKVCLKGSFLLSWIDQLVDSTVGHELRSFLDAYSGYN